MALFAVANFTVGRTLEVQAALQRGSGVPADQGVLRDAVTAGTYSHLSATLPTLTSTDFTRPFEFGLGLLIEGLRAGSPGAAGEAVLPAPMPPHPDLASRPTRHATMPSYSPGKTICRMRVRCGPRRDQVVACCRAGRFVLLTLRFRLEEARWGRVGDARIGTDRQRQG
ncbi:TetR/AcrR family transcriptional regulator C-terminal domain-containing protein [Streptomyces sp. NPDC057424]|uniref:TetR/AcrR family transcriptional regulator C-terminal domain-containing protein n=1 Tax=Streptomyces sp. NPDC057424 TaxID=3346127 RepID=UPI0036922BA0